MLREYFQRYQITDYLGPAVIGDVKFDCALGTNPYLDTQIVEDCLERATWTVNAYEFSAYDPLRDRLLAYWRGTVPGLDRRNLAFGAGTFGLIRDTCTFTLDRGGMAWGYAPQFPRIESEVRLRRARYGWVSMEPPLKKAVEQAGVRTSGNRPKKVVEQAPRGGNADTTVSSTDAQPYRFDADRLLARLPEPVDLVYLDSPNNPTGQVIPLADIARITARARDLDAIVLVDEAYGDYVDQGRSAINLVPLFDNLAVIRSASKFWGLPNHRIGYVVAHPGLIELYDKVTAPFPFTDFSARVFTYLLDRADEVERSRELVRRAKTELMALPGVLTTDPATPILTLPIPAEALAARGIIGESCGINHGLGTGYSRLRLTTNTTALVAELAQIHEELPL